MVKSLLLVVLVLAGTWVSGQPLLPRSANDLTHDLVAYYPFNGNANDESGNGHDGVVSGATLTADRFGNSGSAYNFNGSSDFISTSDLATTTTDNWSITAWIKPATLNQLGTVVINGFDNGGASNNGYSILLGDGGSGTGNKLTGLFSNVEWINPMLTLSTDNVWYQVDMVRNNGTTTLYLNGVAGAVTTTAAPGIPSGSLRIGSQMGLRFFNGAIDEVKIYNRPLSAEEILLEYNSSETGLVAYFPFNENANDESGNGNNGTLMNGAFFTSDRLDNANEAVQFDKSLSQYVKVPNSPSLQIENAISFSFWLKRNTLGGVDQVLNKGGDWPYGNCNYGLVFSDWTLCFIYDGGYYIVDSPGVPQDYEWHHYAVTAVKGTTEIHFYVDGVEKPSMFGEGNPTINFYSQSTADLHISGVNYFSNNSMDELKIYNKILTANEISSLYWNLVAFYPFNGNAEDVSGNMNNGIVNSAVLTTDRFGNANSAYYFDGKNSFIEGINPGNNLPEGNSPRTFVGWIKENSFHPWGNNIFHYGLDQAAPTNFHFYTTDVIRFGNGYDFGVVAGTTPVVDSTWHFVAGVYEGGTEHVAKVYVDGKLNNTGNLSSEPNTVLGSNWKIGRFMTGVNNFDGKIDDLRIYASALTDQEINDIYLSETTAPALLQPENLSTVTGLTPLMEWKKINTNSEYTFQLSDEPGFESFIYQSKISESAFHLPENLLTKNGTYYWRVRTKLNGETGPWSPVWSFIIINTGLKKPNQNDVLFRISPNPADASVKINYSLPGTGTGKAPVTLEIVNSVGKSVTKLVLNKARPGNNEAEIETASLLSGIYYCTLKTVFGQTTSKLVVLH